MIIKKRVSLGVKIGILFILVALIPLLITSLVQTQEGERYFRSQALNQLERESGDITFTLYQFFLERFSDIQLLSKNSIIRDNKSSIAEKRRELQHVAEINQFYDDITLLDAKGRVVTSTTFTFRDLSKTEWFKNALKGQEVISEPIIILSPKKTVMNFFHPVFDSEGDVSGVIVTQLNMKHVWDLIDTIEIEESAFVTMIDHYGNILTHPNKEILFKKIETVYPELQDLSSYNGTLTYSDDYDSYLAGYSFLTREIVATGKKISWTVIVSRKERDALALLKTFRNQIWKILFYELGIVLLIIFFVSRGIVNPLKKLNKTTREITSGNLDAEITVHTGDEIGELAESFDIMKREIKKSQKTLEDKVKVRTLELEIEKKSVERKVVARTKNLRNANLKINQLLRQKDIFIGQVAHDLRTPLTPIIGSLQLLQYKVKDKKNKHLIEEALRNADYLMNLLNETLAMAVSDTDKRNLHLEEANLSVLIGKVIEGQRLVFDKKGIKIIKKIKKTPNVFVDKTKIEEVVNNIISNAYKFVRKDPKFIFFVRQEGLNVIVSVEDNGVGMKPLTLKKIFQEFYKEDKSRHHLSTGLGLSICKRLVEKHGGKIWATSKGIGTGSTLHFNIPLKKRKFSKDIEN